MLGVDHPAREVVECSVIDRYVMTCRAIGPDASAIQLMTHSIRHREGQEPGDDSGSS